MSGEFIEILKDGFPKLLKLNSFWLRDHCRCNQCYDSETFQRKFNLLDIPIDIKPKSSTLDDSLLKVICKYNKILFFQ